MNGDAMDTRQFANHFIKRDLTLGRDTRLDPIAHRCQLAVPAAIALRPRLK